MKLLRGIGASGLLALLSGSALALNASQTVEREIVTFNADGTERVSYIPADKVSPGESVVYALNIENDQAQDVTDLVLVMPVPAEINYVEGSADHPGAIITFSVDNGHTLSARLDLQIESPFGVRTDQSADITNMRWNLSGPLAAGPGDRLTFKGVLK